MWQRFTKSNLSRIRRELEYHSIWRLLFFAFRKPLRLFLRSAYIPQLSQPSRYAHRHTLNILRSLQKTPWIAEDPQHLASRFPEWADRLHAFGAACANHTVSLNEVTTAHIHLPFDWNRDWQTGAMAPTWYSPCINPLRLEGFDYRRVWETARLQWCVLLLLAAHVHHERSWAELARHAMIDFLNQNPIRRGLHWTSAMEVALRLFSWMQADSLLGMKWPDLRDELFCSGISLHASELSRTLTNKLAVPNNHAIIEAAALATVGLLYPALPDSHNWLTNGSQILVEQLKRQTHDDGINKEMSFGYQRFTTEAVLLWHFVTSRLGKPSRVEDWLAKNLQALAAFRPSNGLWPMISDSDGGRVFRWDPGADYWNFDPILYASAVGLNRQLSPEWEQSPEGVLLAGFPANDTVSQNEPWISGSSGLRCHRIGCAYLIVRGGHLGLGGEHWAGHAHSDLGSLHLWLDATPVIEDSGTFAYCGVDADGWLPFRRSEAHAVVQVGDEEQFIPESLFQNRFQWKCHWVMIQDDQGCIQVSSPDNKICWQRHFTIKSQQLVVVDTILESPIEGAQAYLPFGIGWEPRKENDDWLLFSCNSKYKVRLSSAAPGSFDRFPIHPTFGITKPRFRWTTRFHKTNTWSLAWS